MWTSTTKRLALFATLALDAACSGAADPNDGDAREATVASPQLDPTSAPADATPPPSGEPLSAPPAAETSALLEPSTPPPGTNASPPAPQQALVPTAGEDVLLAPEEPPPEPPTMEACASENAAAELEPVVLAFAFDVSGSMGKGDEPYHSRALKWDPVVAATEAFFADTGSRGLSASLTFFPVDSDDKCDAESYLEPIVPLTALPSSDFAAAIDDATPEDEDDWIGGTPTRAVLEGTYAFLEESLATNPEALHAVVLVTDGHPQGCDDDEDDIEALAEFVAGFADTVPTYVIGVENPVTDEEPDPPDVVSNLHLIAESGGTGSAFLIDTGDAEQTTSDFKAAVNAIRGNSLSCSLAIPEPPSGQTLDTELVNVTYEGTPGNVALVFSDDCSLDDAWRYDDPTAPTTIQLCEDTCARVLDDAAAHLEVEFGCVRRTTPIQAR